MKCVKLALIVCLGMGTALLNVGCSSAPAHQKLAEQLLSLPVSVVSNFQHQYHVKDSDVMSDVKTKATKCYVDSAKKLGKKRNWDELSVFVDRAVDATKGKKFGDHFDAKIAVNKAYQALEKDKGKGYAKDARKLFLDWVRASRPCVSPVLADAAKKVQG